MSQPPLRTEKVRLRTAKGRKISSQRWLERQLNDPYVQAAQKAGYRSRAAFKLLELHDKFQFLKPGARVVDLGAAPGGWTQAALRLIAPEGKPSLKGNKQGSKEGMVVAIDLQEMDPIPGATLFRGDFMDPAEQDRLSTLLPHGADVVLSDMAPASTGHRQTDHLRIMALAESALWFAETVLVPGGVFVAKVLQGGSEKELLTRLKAVFQTVRHVKPPASRSDSAEMYVVGVGYKGAK